MTAARAPHRGLVPGWLVPVLLVALAGWWATAARADVAPEMPANVSAAAVSASRIDVSWDAAAGATSYRVAASTVPGGPYSVVGRTTGTTFSHLGLAESTTYHYVVRSLGESGRSAFSAEVSATTPARPAAPANLAAVQSGATSVALTWDAVSEATRYRVYRGTTTGGPYTVVGSTATASYSDTGLNRGTTYFYIVRSTNGAGRSPASNEASVALPARPDTPANLTAVGTTISTVRLTWDAAPGADLYVIRRSTAAGGPYEKIGRSTATEFDDFGLTPSTEYFYSVAAQHVAGRSAWSPDAAATTADRPPAATGVAASFTGGLGVTVTWDAVPGATHYHVRRSSTSGGPYTFVDEASGTTFDDTVPAIGEYFYVVRAAAAVGLSDRSAEAAVLVDEPPVVSDMNFTIQSNMAVNVNAAAGLLSGASDPDGPLPLTLSCGSASVPAGAAVGCNADGSFSFDPNPGLVGTDAVRFAFTVCDGFDVCTTRDAIFTLAGPTIWFVDRAAAAGGTGRLSHPFDTLAAAVSAAGSATNQRIFIADSTAHASDVPLKAGGWLVGAGAAHGAGFDSLMGITPPESAGVDTIDRPAIGGSRPNIQGTVSLGGNGGTVRGVTIAPAAGAAGLTTTTPSSSVSVGGPAADVAVSTVGARAVDLSDASGTFRFATVDADGGTRGISLVNVSATAFAVGGGTIQNVTERGMHLQDTQNISLSNMTITGSAADGIYGTSVANFSLSDSTLDLNGTSQAGNHAGVRFDGLTGTALFTDTTVKRSINHNVSITNPSGSLTVNVDGGTYGPKSATTGANGFLAIANGGTITTTVDGTTFSGNYSDGLQTVTTGSGAMSTTVRNSTFTGNGGTGANVAGSGSGLSTFLIENNTLTGQGGHGINVNMGAGTGTLSGSVRNNVIGAAATASSGSAAGNGIDVLSAGNGNIVAQVSGNLIRQVAQGVGISASAQEGSGKLDVTLANNDIDMPTTAFDAIMVNSGANVGDLNSVCVNATSNDADATGTAASNGLFDAAGISVIQNTANAALRVQGYAGAPTDDVGMANYVASQNPAASGPGGAAFAQHSTGYTTSGASCLTP